MGSRRIHRELAKAAMALRLWYRATAESRQYWSRGLRRLATALVRAWLRQERESAVHSQPASRLMKTTRVSPRAKTLNDLLNRARRQAVILETVGGEKFVLASIEGWEEYTLPKDGDITKNKRLMKQLETRRRPAKPIPIAEVKRELGLT